MPNNCKNCGAALPAGRQSCPRCGAAVTPEHSAAAAQQQTPRTAARSPSGQSTASSRSGSPRAAVQVEEDKRPRRGPFRQETLTEEEREQRKRDRPLSVWGYFWSAFVLHIPLFGLIVQILWVVGGTKNRHRRRYAASCLIWTCLGLVLAFMLSGWFFREVYPELDRLLSSIHHYFTAT